MPTDPVAMLAMRRLAAPLLLLLLLLAVAVVASACKGGGASSSSYDPTKRTEWLVDPKTAPIPDGYVSGVVDGSPVTVKKVEFFTETSGWNMRVAGTDAASHDIVINVKIKEPIAAGKTYVADRVTATGTQLDVGDTATKKNHGESNLVSVYRVQIDRWDVKPYAGKFEVGAGIAAGRVYIGLQTTEGKQGGVAGTFLEAGVGYLNKPPW